jgi:hypothetical protein
MAGWRTGRSFAHMIRFRMDVMLDRKLMMILTTVWMRTTLMRNVTTMPPVYLSLG